MNFFLLSSFVVLIAPSSAAGPPPHAKGGGRPTTLPATANVADAVRSNPRGKFVIEGLALRDDEGGNPFNDPPDVSLRATTSYSEGAVHIDEDGKSTPISTDSVVLVPDISEQNFFGAILVNTQTGQSKGFLVDQSGAVGPRGQSYRVMQERAGGNKSAMGLEKGNGSFAPPKDWACDVVGRGRGDDARDLTTGNEVHRHRHHHHHEDEEDATNVIDGGALDHMGESLGLRGANRHRRQLLVGQIPYYTDNGNSDMYSYEVKIYMEYDNDLETNAGGTTQAAEDYINMLNAAVSSVYEYEVDTRITISALQKTTRYDSAPGTSQALNTMTSTWSGSSFGGGTSGIDLHHALLGNGLGGGIAYLGVVCNSNSGMGLSANMDANFANITDPEGLVWDWNVYAHEVGHNFAAEHTHSWSAGGGDVDTCGDGQCPSELPSIGKATIMSYCHQCGGESNMGPTFGGHRDISGTTWLDESTLGSFNVDPHRVPEKMYDHVSSRGTCVVPDGPIPKQTCDNGILDDDEDCENGFTITETCTSLGDYPLLTGGTLACTGCAWDTSNCNGCGNGARDGAEACDKNDFGDETCITKGFPEGGSLSCSSDCLNIGTSGCMEVVMEETNIEARKRNDATFMVNINKATHSIKIAISGGSGDADLYVKYGAAPDTNSYDCRPYTNGNNEACTYSSSVGNDQGMYYILIRAYRNFSGLTLKVTSDDATPITSTPTSTPTASPTAAPQQPGTPSPTGAPTKNPTESPSKPPTSSPSTPPTSQPTAAPQQPGTPSPTGAPTKNPTESPSKPPSNPPSTPPTAQPTEAPQQPGTPSPTGAPTKNPTESPSKPPSNSPSTPPTSQPQCSGLQGGTPCDHRGSCVESSGDCCTECCAGEFTGSGNSKVCA